MPQAKSVSLPAQHPEHSHSRDRDIRLHLPLPAPPTFVWKFSFLCGGLRITKRKNSCTVRPNHRHSGYSTTNQHNFLDLLLAQVRIASAFRPRRHPYGRPPTDQRFQRPACESCSNTVRLARETQCPKGVVRFAKRCSPRSIPSAAPAPVHLAAEKSIWSCCRIRIVHDACAGDQRSSPPNVVCLHSSKST